MVLFYVTEVNVEKSSADSAQSIVFFGRESSMKIRVVLKQYSGKSFKSIFKEIKIFTMLEAHKKS
jgi:serine/threonine protein kinase